MITHKSTKMRRSPSAAGTYPYESMAGFADALKLRSMADRTQGEYQRYLRKLAERVGRDPALLDESQVRAPDAIPGA